ncbi:MAG: SDR family oxidoreductase [Firmicutes bacterium]|nr:SDR family oxidoreductase [Bacillota bacterium]
MGGFAGRVVVITGASRGIGYAVARRFAEEGAAVAMLARDAARLGEVAREMCKTTGRTARGYPCDVGDPRAVQAVAAAVVSEMGIPDVLVNNAGGMTQRIPFADIDDETWEAALRVNLSGVFYCSRAFARAMISASRRGAIVNVGSSAGIAPKAGRAHYSTSKGAVHVLTKALAAEMAAYGIRANAVSPGLTLTERIAARLADPEEGERERQRVQKIPLKRMASPEEVAEAILFLASEKAAYITGAILPVDGGYTLGV